MTIFNFTGKKRLDLYCLPNNNNENQVKTDPINVLDYYSSQSKYTDPGKYSYLYEGIPSNVPEIVNIVQGLLLHLAQVENNNIPITERRLQMEINYQRKDLAD